MTKQLIFYSGRDGNSYPSSFFEEIERDNARSHSPSDNSSRSNQKVLAHKQEQNYERVVKQQVEIQKEELTFIPTRTSFSKTTPSHSLPRTRAEAIRFTLNNADTFETRSYEFENKQAYDLLGECHINPQIFKDNHVNALQNEINYEVVDIITEAANIRYTRPEESIHHLMHASVHGSIAAKSCGALGEFVKSFKILDWCNSLIQWAREKPIIAAAEGIIRGGINVATLTAASKLLGPWTTTAVMSGKLIYDNFLESTEKRTQALNTACSFFKFLHDLIPPDKELYYKFGLIHEYETENAAVKVNWQRFFNNLEQYNRF